MVEALEPFALYYAGAVEDQARAMATAYGLGYVIRQEPVSDRRLGGMSTWAASEIGIPAITAEAGGCGLVAEPAVQAHVRGLDRILAQLGMTSGPAGDAPPPTLLRQFIWLRCRDAGWWEPAVRTGQSVNEGQLLGTVSTLDGAQVLETITAPTAGVPMFMTSSPAVAADGLLLGLGAAQPAAGV
jgi:predicted deacylase